MRQIILPGVDAVDEQRACQQQDTGYREVEQGAILTTEQEEEEYERGENFKEDGDAPKGRGQDGSSLPIGQEAFQQEAAQEQIGLTEKDIVDDGDKEDDGYDEGEIARDAKMPDDACNCEQEQDGAEKVEQEFGGCHGEDDKRGEYQGGKRGEGGIGYEIDLVSGGCDMVIEGLHVVGGPIVSCEQEVAACVIAGKVGPGHHL